METRRQALQADLDKINGDLLEGGVLEDDLPMYFRKPEQLQAVNHSLEQNNLFLIQQAQDTEEALEKVTQLSSSTATHRIFFVYRTRHPTFDLTPL